MGFFTFRGGIHPYDGKELSKAASIQSLQPGKELVYPLAQHIGAPAIPVVAIGERVLTGQKIAEAKGMISTPVLSSVSGMVTAVKKHLVASGDLVESIVVENDGLYEEIAGFGAPRDVSSLSKAEIRSIVREAGIVGLGGAGFPTHVKLTPKDDDIMEFIVINGAECEPYLTSDYREMLECPEKIVGGLKVIMQLFPRAQALIAVEDNKPEAALALKAALHPEDGIEIRILRTKYPQGAERQLIAAATGRKISGAKLPVDAGCLVINVDTAVSIYEAVCESTPLIRRILTVTGDGIETPGNYRVRLGMSYEELVHACGGFRGEPEKLISGGPMMGTALFSTAIPVTKNSSALLCLSKDEAAEQEPTACIHCGRCVQVCPCRLVPQMMYEAAIRSDKEAYVRVNGMECYECGCCSYICPARIRLTQAFRETRRTIIQERGGKK